MLRRTLDRRALATLAAVVAGVTGGVAGVSLAAGNTAPQPAPATAPAGPGGILAGVHRFLSDLVASGTIDRQQADAVQTEANAGSIDPKSLVPAVMTDAQMRAVAAGIDQLKRDYGG